MTAVHPSPAEKEIWQLLETVSDPEVPVLSVVDLGVVRDVTVKDDGSVNVIITPTYTGCPAMDVIRISIYMALRAAGYQEVNIEQVLSPAWTTDWMSEAGKQKLKEYGIAPPYAKAIAAIDPFAAEEPITCPHCGSTDTKLVSQFGSTACKALYQCNACYEPFDYFKCH